MDADRWRRIEDLFESALGVAGAERSAFLARECCEDTDLRVQVERLLQSDGDAESFLADPAFDLAELTHDLRVSRVGKRVGPYRLEREIASGGMGTVYLGVRDDEHLIQRVAIKLIRVGMDIGPLLRRFDLERRAVAALDHPNIARCLDGGRTEDGLPYLVMEFIDGQALDTYCESRALTLRERLQLFRSVCDGVEYAHRKLIVHRDIKCGNILVTQEGFPKLLDFGIAKLLDPGTSNAALTSGTLCFLSPEYASPEQLRGEPVSTATDVYSLGVTLYELLSGRRPYSAAGRSPAELERVVCETDPVRPSHAIEGPDRAGLRRELAGDLDTIVMKALRKEPDERYASVAQLNEDIRRYTDGLPVTARKPTLRYRAGKFLRRNRAVSVATVLLLLTLLVGTLAVLRETRRARTEAATTARVLTYLDRLLADLDPQVGGMVVPVEEILDRGGDRAVQELADLPKAQAMLAERIAGIYAELRLQSKAVHWYERAVSIYRAEFGDDHPKVADNLNALGWVLNQSDPHRAEKLLRQALEARIRLYGQQSPQVALTKAVIAGTLWQFQGNYEQAEPLIGESVELARRAFSEPHPDLVTILDGAAGYWLTVGDYERAERLSREAVAVAERLPAPHTAHEQRRTLAGILHDTGRYREAEPLYRACLEGGLQRLGPVHPSVLVSRRVLAQLLKDMGDYDGAEKLLRENLAALELMPREESNLHLASVTWSSLASALWLSGDATGAEAAIRRGLEHVASGTIRAERSTLLAQVLSATGRYAEAERVARDALGIMRENLPQTSWKIADTESILGAALVGLRRFEEAEPLLVDSYPIIREDRGPTHRCTRDALVRTVGLYEAWSKPDEVVRYRRLVAEASLESGQKAEASSH